jgi:hypothetical protein
VIKACDTGKSLKEHVGSHLVDPSAYSPIRSSAAAAEFAGIKDLANCTSYQIWRVISGRALSHALLCPTGAVQRSNNLLMLYPFTFNNYTVEA